MPISDVALTHELPLLADRVVVRVPFPFFADPPFTRHGGIMGYERRSPRKHRAGFETSGAKLRMVADEHFRTTVGLAEHVRGLAGSGFGDGLGSARTLELDPGRHYLVLADALPVVAEGTAHFLGESYLALPDGLVVEVRYYVDRAGLALHGPAEMHQLAIALARSATPGERRYARGPASVTLGARPGQPVIELDLVRDWVPTLDLGPDFSAHRFLKALAYGANDERSLLLYLGRHPSAQRPPGAKDVKVRMLGELVPGFATTETVDGRTQHTVEAVAAIAAHRLACHAVLKGESVPELEDLWNMLASSYVLPAREVAAPAPAPAPEAATVAKPAGPDFDALCGAAHPSGGTGPRAAMDALWTAAFALDVWHFAVAKDRPTAPLVYELQGKRWAFVFTDAARALRFYEENAAAVGGAHRATLALRLDGARGWIRQAGAEGLFGVQFNYAQPGWFAPWEGVDRIWSHLRG